MRLRERAQSEGVHEIAYLQKHMNAGELALLKKILPFHEKSAWALYKAQRAENEARQKGITNKIKIDNYVRERLTEEDKRALQYTTKPFVKGLTYPYESAKKPIGPEEIAGRKENFDTERKRLATLVRRIQAAAHLPLSGHVRDMMDELGKLEAMAHPRTQEDIDRGVEYGPLNRQVLEKERENIDRRLSLAVDPNEKAQLESFKNVLNELIATPGAEAQAKWREALENRRGQFEKAINTALLYGRERELAPNQKNTRRWALRKLQERLKKEIAETPPVGTEYYTPERGAMGVPPKEQVRVVTDFSKRQLPIPDDPEDFKGAKLFSKEKLYDPSVVRARKSRELGGPPTAYEKLEDLKNMERWMVPDLSSRQEELQGGNEKADVYEVVYDMMSRSARMDTSDYKLILTEVHPKFEGATPFVSKISLVKMTKDEAGNLTPEKASSTELYEMFRREGRFEEATPPDEAEVRQATKMYDQLRSFYDIPDFMEMGRRGFTKTRSAELVDQKDGIGLSSKTYKLKRVPKGPATSKFDNWDALITVVNYHTRSGIDLPGEEGKKHVISKVELSDPIKGTQINSLDKEDQISDIFLNQLMENFKLGDPVTVESGTGVTVTHQTISRSVGKEKSIPNLVLETEYTEKTHKSEDGTVQPMNVVTNRRMRDVSSGRTYSLGEALQHLYRGFAPPRKHTPIAGIKSVDVDTDTEYEITLRDGAKIKGVLKDGKTTVYAAPFEGADWTEVGTSDEPLQKAVRLMADEAVRKNRKIIEEPPPMDEVAQEDGGDTMYHATVDNVDLMGRKSGAGVNIYAKPKGAPVKDWQRIHYWSGETGEGDRPGIPVGTAKEAIEQLAKEYRYYDVANGIQEVDQLGGGSEMYQVSVRVPQQGEDLNFEIKAERVNPKWRIGGDKKDEKVYPPDQQVFFSKVYTFTKMKGWVEETVDGKDVIEGKPIDVAMKLAREFVAEKTGLRESVMGLGVIRRIEKILGAGFEAPKPFAKETDPQAPRPPSDKPEETPEEEIDLETYVERELKGDGEKEKAPPPTPERREEMRVVQDDDEAYHVSIPGPESADGKTREPGVEIRGLIQPNGRTTVQTRMEGSDTWKDLATELYPNPKNAVKQFMRARKPGEKLEKHPGELKEIEPGKPESYIEPIEDPLTAPFAEGPARLYFRFKPLGSDKMRQGVKTIKNPPTGETLLSKREFTTLGKEIVKRELQKMVDTGVRFSRDNEFVTMMILPPEGVKPNPNNSVKAFKMPFNPATGEVKV
jgi:hypothetical protein